MHHLQTEIIRRLTLAPELRYNRIKPQGMESNLFVHHLKTLVNKKLVEKTTVGYRLTPEGKRWADRLSLTTREPRIQPKIVTLIACKNEEDEWLLYRRGRQPFIGRVGFPYGKIHLKETILEAAERELEEKTGLQAPLCHIGDAYVAMYDTEGELISHMLAHVFFGEQPTGELTPISPIGDCFWADPATIDKEKLVPGFQEVFTLITKRQTGRFFAELSLTDH